MALPNLLEEEEPKEQAQEPDYKALYEQERTEREAFTQQVERDKAAYDARLGTLERVARPVEQQPVAAPQRSWKQWTEEEILQKPLEAIADISERKAYEAKQELNQHYSQLLGAVVEDNFDLKLDKVQNKRFGAILEPHMRQYFDQNPHLKLQRGSIDQVYRMFVADHLDELLQLENGAEKAVESERPEKSKPAPKTPPRVAPRSVATPLTDSSEKDPELSEDEETTRKKFEKLGVPMTRQEWAQIRDGRLLP